MPAPLKWRRKVALAKLEPTYATDSAPTGAANAMLLSNVEIRPMEGEDTTREIEWPHLGAQPQIPTGLRATLTGSIELVGSGTEGVAPAWGPLLRACGCAQVITPDTSVAYTPISTEMESVTIHFWIDGIRHVLRGARGTVEIGINAQSVPSARFTMTGLWSKPTDTAPATPNFNAFRVPLVATMAHTPTFQVAGTPLVLRSFGFNMGNSVEPRLLIGREEILITDRQELISATVEATPLATLDPFELAQDQNNTFAVTITHGITAGFRTTIAAPRCQMMRLEGYENNQNVLEWPLRMRPLFNTGNDQFSITLH